MVSVSLNWQECWDVECCLLDGLALVLWKALLRSDEC